MGIKFQRKVCSLLGALLVLGLAAYPAAAGQLKSISVEQAWNQENEIIVYFEASDIDGAAVSGIKPDNLQARLGETETSIARLGQFDSNSEGIAWVVLVDVSRSLDAEQFKGVTVAVQRLIEKMSASDRMALMSFGTEVRTVCDYTADTALLNQSILSMSAADDNTQMYQGLLQALEMARRKDSGLPQRKAIVLISDGSEDYYGGVSKEEVLNSFKVQPVPVFSLGIFNPRIDGDAGLENMGEIARASGGQAWQYEANALYNGADALMNKVKSTYVLRLDASKCPHDGRDYRLVLQLKQDGTEVEDGITIYMSEAVPPPPQEAEQPAAAVWSSITSINSFEDLRSLPSWILASIGGLVLILICFIIILIVKKNKRSRSNRNLPQVYSDNGFTRDYEEFISPGTGPYDSTHQDGYQFGGLAGQQAGAAEPASPGMPLAASGPGMPGHGGTQPVRSGANAPLTKELQPASPGANHPVATTTIVLTALGRGMTGRTFRLQIGGNKNILTVGRKSGNDLMITDDDRVSARHCQFIFDKGRVYIQDLDSTNGTLVNGVPITGRYGLEPEDLILIGKTELRYASKRDNGGPEL